MLLSSILDWNTEWYMSMTLRTFKMYPSKYFVELGSDFYLELSSFFAGFPVVNDPLYNHVVFGPEKGKGGRIGKSDEKLIEV